MNLSLWWWLYISTAINDFLYFSFWYDIEGSTFKSLSRTDFLNFDIFQSFRCGLATWSMEGEKYVEKYVGAMFFCALCYEFWGIFYVQCNLKMRYVWNCFKKEWAGGHVSKGPLQASGGSFVFCLHIGYILYAEEWINY